MKNIIMLLAVTLTILASCKNSLDSLSKEETGNQISAQFGAEVKAKKNQLLKINNSELIIKTEEINESRCPSDAICIRYGEAQAQFKISNQSAEKTIKLCIGECFGEPKTYEEFELGQNRYTIELTEIGPYPSTQNGGEQKYVLFKVSKIN